MFLRLRLFENAAESPMQTTSGDIWDEIEAVITPFAKDNQEIGSNVDISIKIPSLKQQISDARRSLFSGKRVADDTLEVESPATKKSKALLNTTNIIEAVERLESRELIADGTRCYTLPTIPGKHGDLKSISSETMADIMEGRFTEQLGNVTIVDCRYPYEFEEGHIRGAVNLYTKDAVNTLHHETTTSSEKPRVLIFHCEFSSERGLKMYRFLRSQDRELNKDKYPYLNFPEIYLLDGGYKTFFYKFHELCDPINYKPMLHEDHAADLRHFRVKSKSWTAGEKQKTSRRSKRRLACYNIDF